SCVESCAQSLCKSPAADARHSTPHPSRRGQMELFTKLFGSLLVFVYHCFDRIVINGYLSALTRPEQVVYFFREIVGVQVVDKEVLSRRTGEYQDWVEAFARNHDTPIEWAERACARTNTLTVACVRWCGPSATGCTSSSRAWSRGRRFAARCRSIRPATPTTASWLRSAVASRTTTSTFVTK